MKDAAPLDTAKITVTDQSQWSTTFCGGGGAEVIRIDYEGRIFWKGREVESDADFRAAMLDLAHKWQRP